MKGLKVAVLVGLVVFAAPLAAGRDVPAALKPYMTQDEYRAAGLHKLNPAELAQFQAWFVRTMDGAPPPSEARVETVAPTAVVDTPAPGRTEGERRFGTEQLENERTLVAHIIGTFNGWNGPTRFELDNGQVWETLSGANFTPLAPIPNAQVTITRGAFNSYRLKVEGYNRSVQVKRIE